MRIREKRAIGFASLVLALLLVGLWTGRAVAGDKEHGHGHEHGKKHGHWGYSGDTGPEHWGEISKEFSACSEGHEQSPIDISGAARGRLDKIEFHYAPTGLEILNNGHTVQVNYEEGSYIKVDGVRYDLLQFHFHTPSEHTVNAKSYDMEMHLVHKSRSGGLAVVSLLVEKGRENPAFRVVWSNLPERAGSKKSVKASVDASSLLPADRSYYAYDGSLTTPPCSEGVKWHVLKTPVQMSAAQIDAMGSILHHNNRPVQPINKRRVVR